jgi:hypothetical protein
VAQNETDLIEKSKYPVLFKEVYPKTYTSDLKFGCDIQTLLELIDAKLLEYSPPPPIFNENEIS